MNRAMYEQFEESVKEFFDSEGITNLTRIAGAGDSEDGPEPFFSSLSCRCCGSQLAGNRIECSGWNPLENEVRTYFVCQDCEYYAEYGILDDMTMLGIAEQEDQFEYFEKLVDKGE